MVKAILGIDVSKKELSLALWGNNSYKKYKVPNTLPGFKDLLSWVKTQKVHEVKVCMEATGSYGEKVADYLYEQEGYSVHVINPACIKAFAKSKLSRHKTDEVDAILIAEYALKNELRAYKPKDPILKELRLLYRCSQNLKQQKRQFGNFLENEERLPKSVKIIYKDLIKSIDKKIQTTELAMEDLFTQQESLKNDYERLQTITGIGKTTAVAILAEIPDLSSLENARQLAAYAGLTPSHKTSGTSLRGKSRLSKMGSSHLRKALYFPAIVAKNHNPLLKTVAQKLSKKGKHVMVVIGAIMRKLLHIIFGVLKNKTNFNQNIFETNP